MSRSVSSIKYINASDLLLWIKQGSTVPIQEPFQVIDVRGSDHIGGHIINSWNYPYKKLKEYEYDNNSVYLKQLKTNLLKKLKEFKEKEQNLGDNVNDIKINCVFHCALSQQRGPSSAMMFLRSLGDADLDKFRILILRGGFNNWQSVYGLDSNLTQDYEPSLWK
ncbi:phosphatase YCH1 SCDLUD_004843 [Saccharomycodes ludwigii]|uniref:phosphatase YCH1 n=1 Tax=Saccharomycodes ludwigii TaxID=36035 RepID=UPI001E89C3BB|nr:hypothetical protein SCDLUD_004843 [Saccharomycodes ludwigii]KAH3899400.1 hypothetical protein SCDLUD_004843 [Saccharomycodes ludwigii]